MAGEKILNPLKITFFGPAKAGKTSLLTRFMYGSYDSTYQSTIGIDFLSKTFQVTDEVQIKANLWDTAGEERFKSLVPSYLRDSAAIVIVLALEHDPDNQLTPLKYLAQQASKYYEEAEVYGVPVYFIINKSDSFKDFSLDEDRIKGALPPSAQGKISFCSAQDNVGITKAFKAIGATAARVEYKEEEQKKEENPEAILPSGPLFELNLGIWGIGNIALAIAAIVTIATLASIPTGGISLLAGLTVLGVAGIAVGAAVLLWNLCWFIADHWKKDGGGGPTPTGASKNDDLSDNWVFTSPSSPQKKQTAKYEPVPGTKSGAMQKRNDNDSDTEEDESPGFNPNDNDTSDDDSNNSLKS